MMLMVTAIFRYITTVGDDNFIALVISYNFITNKILTSQCDYDSYCKIAQIQSYEGSSTLRVHYLAIAAAAVVLIIIGRYPLPIIYYLLLLLSFISPRDDVAYFFPYRFCRCY